MQDLSSNQKILSLIRKNRINHLYHFTDIYNLPTIVKYGLLPKSILEERGFLDKVVTGGNPRSKELDVRYDNWNKISFSLCPKLPMAYYREMEMHIFYIKAKIELCTVDEVVFVDRNATANDQKRGFGLMGLELLDFEAIRSDHPYPNKIVKIKKQAEVLIPRPVDIDWFDALSFRSKSSLCYARHRLENLIKHLQLDNRHKSIQGIFEKLEVDESLFCGSHAYIERHEIKLIKSEASQDLILELRIREISGNVEIILEFQNQKPNMPSLKDSYELSRTASSLKVSIKKECVENYQILDVFLRQGIGKPILQFREKLRISQ
ncbi:MAG: DUF4433 domain-containing protein [Limnothrix sp. CACIAM 69d]|nr:MAG: DUF4433 domain-containing protein [Limnothrix sp. CACIAM 69d]